MHGNGSLGVTVTCSDGNVEVSADVPDGTAAAIYTVSGVKVASATFTGGKALLRGVPAGAAVLTAGNTASKLVVR